MNKQPIKHMVIFNLKHGIQSPESAQFLRDGQEILSGIPDVRNFEVLRQVSVKNDYDFGFSMEFEDQAAYDRYNIHPAHVTFVKQRWETEVIKFLEIDFTAN